MNDERIRKIADGDNQDLVMTPEEKIELASALLVVQKRVAELEEEVRQAAIDSAFHATHPSGGKMHIENIDEMEKISAQFDEAYCRGQMSILNRYHDRLMGLVAQAEKELDRYSKKLYQLRNGEKG